MAIDIPRPANSFTSTTDFRLRLVTLLSLCDLLPHSISRPPNAEEPVELNDALSPALVQHCFDILQEHELHNPLDEHSSAETQQAQVSSSHPDTVACLQGLATINAHMPLWSRALEEEIEVADEINKPARKKGGMRSVLS